MTYHEIDPIIINGTRFPLSVNDNGQFHSTYAANTYTGSSRTDVIRQLEEALKRSRLRISVPFTRLGKAGVVKCEVTGKHARTGSWLLNTGNSKGEQERYLRSAIRPLTPEETTELNRLIKARNDAADALDAYTQDKFFDLASAANKAWANVEK